MAQLHSRIAALVLVCLLAATSAFAAPSPGQPAQGPAPTPTAGPDGGLPEGGRDITPQATCSTPRTQSIRGKDVTFDQCYDRAFSHGGTNYRIQTYYTETDSALNLSRCNATENAAGRCEHAIADGDDGSGNNLNAVAMAAEGELAMRFYHDRNLLFLPAGVTDLEIFIAQDPRAGGTPTVSSINVLDDWVDNNDVLQKRLLALHEVQHLMQYNYQGAGGWQGFFGEGIARAIEDRVNGPLDADTGHLFIPEVNGILNDNASRTADISTISYPSVLWWTWLMDQYRLGGESAPALGWSALRDFYTELSGAPDQLNALNGFISDKGSSFRNDFIDYSLAMYAYRYAPSDPRLGFLDAEISNPAVTTGLLGHTVLTGGPAFGTVSPAMAPRSSRYYEFNPANQCAFTAFTFDGNGKQYGFSVMTVDGGALQKRWTSYSSSWARTVRTSDLDRLVGVVTAIDQSGTVDVGRGCVTPSLNIKSPTSAAFDMVGLASNPRQFIVRLAVTGADGSAVAGLTAGDFQVQLRKAGGGPLLSATIVNSTYVQDNYWLLVQAPNDAAGAESGAFYDLIMGLGSASDTENSAVLYVERTQDVVLVLDHSGSMGGTTGRIEAARNAANLLANELSDDDQGGYVAFDDTVNVRVPLAPMSNAGQRTNLHNLISAEVPAGLTSIGGGMQAAASEHDLHKDPDNICSFVLMSDGHENAAPFWADVTPAVADNGCAIHTIGLGPGANEPLLQQIAAAAPGGSYDYADVSGSVPLRPSAAITPAAAEYLSWPNSLSRIYDSKAIQIQGRQRIQTLVSKGRQGAEERQFYVDDTSDLLVLTIGWQNTSDAHQIKLFDPDGVEIDPTGVRRRSPSFTNEVWTVKQPKPGFWKLSVANMFQEYFVSPSVRSNYELYLFIGTPIEHMVQGVQVPIFATFAGQGKPILGADVLATIREPDGSEHSLRLYDDGSHNDSEANDGIYANLFHPTSAADQVQLDPQQVIENEEPQAIGSYLVNVVGFKDPLRREAQGSFALSQAPDQDKDRMPDGWELEHGLDPTNGQDAGDDPDRDKLVNFCEFRLGTHPRNSDTDSGGERDGSEAPSCVRGTQDPLNGDDDRVRPLSSFTVRPEFTLASGPLLRLLLGNPPTGILVSSDLFRRVVDNQGNPLGDWQPLATGFVGNSYDDTGVQAGQFYEYQVAPLIDPAPVGGAGLAAPLEGRVLQSVAAQASDDPYAPSGTVVINDGDATTAVREVTLRLTADDSGPDEDGNPSAPPPPGTPVDQLQMRISNSPDFTGVAWQPFAPLVANWTLAQVAPNSPAAVYVQFKDAAGNIGEHGFGQVDTIVVSGGTLYLPVVAK